jgi:hypothetical protein
VDKRQSDTIDAELQDAGTQFHNEVKLLLLGTGESGKSTIFKQMKIIHSNGFTESERRFYAGHARANLIVNMKVLVHGAKSLGFKLEGEAVLVRLTWHFHWSYILFAASSTKNRATACRRFPLGSRHCRGHYAVVER